MLKHAGMMEPQPAFTPVFDNCSSKDLQWRTWVKRETKIRYVYVFSGIVRSVACVSASQSIGFTVGGHCSRERNG